MGEDPDYHGELGLLLHNEVKKDCLWSAGVSLGHLLVLLPSPINVVNQKPQQANPGRMKMAEIDQQ